jgi:hypothetical protein
MRNKNNWLEDEFLVQSELKASSLLYRWGHAVA